MRRTVIIAPADFPAKWIERFWSRVDRGEPSACWPWRAMRNDKGYGIIAFKRYPRLAHRIAFALAKDQTIESGIVICHRCDNPPCCNPWHLFSGTDQDNHDDRGRKGRTRVGVGELAAMSKLTDANIREIRSLYPKYTKSELARMFGVQSASTIAAVLAGKTWKHVT